MNFLIKLIFLHMFIVYTYTSTIVDTKLQLDQEKIEFHLSSKVYDNDAIGQFTNELLFDCKNNVSGLFEIVKQDQVNLYPSNRLKASKQFKCYPNSFLASKGVASFQFTTENFQLKKILYSYESNKLRTNLWFNEVIEYSDLLKNLRMFTHIKQSKNKLKYSMFPKRASKTFIIDIPMQKALLENQKFTIEISGGLKSIDGIQFQSDYLGLIEPKKSSKYLENSKKAELVFRDNAVFEAVSNGKMQLKVYLPQLLTNSKPLDYISVFPKTDLKVGVNEYNYYSYDNGSKSNCYLTIEGDFKAKTNYKIILKKGFATNNFELKNDKSIKLTTPNLQQYFKFVNSKTRLSSKNQSFEIEYANQTGVNIVLQKLLPQNYRYFVNFKNGDDDNFERYSKVVISKKTKLFGVKNKVIRKTLDLSEITKSTSGIFKLSAYSTLDNEQKFLDSRLLHISDCGISAMMTKTELLISTKSLQTSKPLSNTLIKIYSQNNQLLHQGFSDHDGLMSYKIQGSRSKLYSLIATYNKQKSFLLMDYPIGKAIFDTQLNDQYKALLHLERGLIRPSESVSLAIVVKGYDFKSNDLPVKLVVKDPSGTIVKTEVLKSDSIGVYESNIQSQNFWKTGSYTCQVLLANTIIGSSTLKIESFLPPKIKNTIDISNRNLFEHETISLKLQSKYYFGAPASGLKSEVKLSAFARSNRLKLWPQYTFGDHRDLNNNDDYLLKSYPMTNPANGKIKFNQAIKLNKKSTLVLDGLVSFSTFDDAKEINSYQAFTIFPSHRMIGIKPSFKNRVKTNQDHKFELIIVDPKDNKPLDGDLEAKLYKKVWHYQFDTTRNYGGYSEQYVLIESKILSVDQKLNYNLTDSGNYYLEVSDLGGNHVSSFTYYVSGWSYGGPSQNSNTNSLKLSSSLSKVKLGEDDSLIDELEIDVQGQMSGSLLLVVEDGQILYKNQYELSGTTASIKLPLIKTNGQSFSIHGYLIRPANLQNSVLSFRSYGNLDITVTKDQYKINPMIEVQKKARSNQQIKVKVSEMNSGDLCFISAVDQGIHDMIGEQFNNPFDAFLKRKKQTLEYYDFYNDLDYMTSNLERQSFGGDEPSNQRRKRHLSPDSLNDRVKSFSHWSSLKTVDSNGEVHWSFPTNNFQGQIQVKTLVVNPKKIGGSSTQLIVSDPIQAKLSLPRYFVDGDRLNIPFRVFNQSADSQRIKMKVFINDTSVFLQKSLFDVKSKEAASGKFVVSTILYKPFDKLKVKVILSSDKGLQFEKNYTVPLLPATQTKTYSQMLALKSNKTIDLPTELFALENPKLIVTVSTDPRKILRKSLNDLISYPYGCAEQTSSKLFALHELSKISPPSEVKAISSFIEAGMSRLLTMQQHNGNFNYWRNGNYVNDFASVYSSEILLKLDSKKYTLPASQKALVIQSLHKYTQLKDNVLVSLYAAFVLRKYAHLSRSQYHALYEQSKNTSELISISLLYALSTTYDEKNRALSLEKKLLNQLKNYQIDRQYSKNFHSVNRDTAMAISLYLQNKGDRSKVQSHIDVLFMKLSQSKLYSTQDKALVLSLFSDEMSKWPIANGSTEILINKKSYAIDPTSPFELSISSPKLELKPLGGFTYIQVEVLYKHPLNVSKVDKTKRLYIQTRLVNDKGEAIKVSELKVSQKVFNEIKINSMDHLDNLVLVSKVPSCFESINPRLNKSFKLPKGLVQKNIVVNNLDLRDDRLISFMSVNKTGVYYHPLQVSFSGKCKLLETKIEAMYDSRISDLSIPINNYNIKH